MSVLMLHRHYIVITVISTLNMERCHNADRLNPPFIFLSCLPFTIFFPFSVPPPSIYSGFMTTNLVSSHAGLPAKELLSRHLCSTLGLLILETLPCISSQF
jgi:hypothetical protein